MTNYEKLRQMDNISLAEWLRKHLDCLACMAKYECWNCTGDCTESLLKWLDSEA